MASILVLAVACALSADKPVPARTLLEKMIESRRAFATADIRWTHTNYSKPHKECRRSRFDGKNWTLEEVADSDGIVRPQLLGKAGACSEYQFLTADGHRWQRKDNDAYVYLFKLESDKFYNLNKNIRPNIDARILGIAPEPTFKDLDGLLPSILGDTPDRNISVKEDGDGVSAVTVKLEYAKLTWWLDTKRSFNPIRIEQRDVEKGELLSWCLIDLAIYDHVWFPSRVLYVSINNQAGTRKQHLYEFTSAEFDRPEHPATLTPKDIGVLPYDTVSWQFPRKMPISCWDGSRVIPGDEIARQQREGELLAETLQPARDRIHRIITGDKGRWPAWMNEPAYGITKPADIDEWEKYVRRFCLIRKCDARQKASAQGILDDCRRRATPITAKAKTEKDPSKRDAILSGVADIFTKSLVPRLEALLSIPQSQPSSQPAKLPPSAGR